MQKAISLGKLFGISIKLHISWFLIFILITWVLRDDYVRSTAGFGDWVYWVAGALTSIIFFCSILAHELAHSLVAKASGIPVKSITLFIFGGVAHILQEPKRPGIEFQMAIAGPLTSLILGGFFWLGWNFCTTSSLLINCLITLNVLNVGVAIFNLIPGYPLDGGRVLRSIIWWRTHNLRKATKTGSYIGRGIGYLFVLAGIVLVFYDQFVNGIWLAFIGLFLENAARGSYRQLLMTEILQGHKVSEIMSRDSIVVSPDITVSQLVNSNVLEAKDNCLIVSQGNQVLGLITLKNLKSVRPNLRTQKTAGEIMTSLNQLSCVRPDEELINLIPIINENSTTHLPVMDNYSCIGIIGRSRLMSFIQTRKELGF
ncbi:MAG: site-2 protease family protein [Chloroflexi bacterium]|nr:site-2 protease family protein [Chloroflexota bacterium]